MAENIESNGCSQRDNAEHEGYVKASRSFNRIWKERDSAQPRLLEAILYKDNFNRAYKRVKANKGAPGIDGMTIEEALPYLKEHQQEFIAFTFFSGWHTGGKSIFMADTITDSAEFMVTPLIGNILVMINKACGVKDDMIVNMIFVNVGADHEALNWVIQVIVIIALIPIQHLEFPMTKSLITGYMMGKLFIFSIMQTPTSTVITMQVMVSTSKMTSFAYIKTAVQVSPYSGRLFISRTSRCVCRCEPASAPEHHPQCGRQATSPEEYDIPDDLPNRLTGHGHGSYPATVRPSPAMSRPAPAARSSSHALWLVYSLF